MQPGTPCDEPHDATDLFTRACAFCGQNHSVDPLEDITAIACARCGRSLAEMPIRRRSMIRGRLPDRRPGDF